MAKGSSKKSTLSKAKAAAKKSTINAVANDARKGGKAKKNAANNTASKTTQSAKQDNSATNKDADKKGIFGIFSRDASKDGSSKNSKKKKKKKKSAPNPKKVAEAYSVYNQKHKQNKKELTSNKHSKPKTSRAKLVKSEEAKQSKQDKKTKGQHSKSAKKKRAGKKTALIIAATLVVALGFSCIAFAADEQHRSQFVPTNTMLDGQIDISGMTQDELRTLLENRVANKIATTVIVNTADSGHEIEMNEVGAIDIDATIDQAFSPYQDNPVGRAVTRLTELVTGESPQNNVSLACAVNEDALIARIDELRFEINRDAKSAGYAYDSGSNSLVVTEAKQGIEMDADSTAALIKERLTDITSDDPNRLIVEAVATMTEPESYEVGQGIYVDTRNCRVSLYEGGQVTISYPCTPGTSGYATPTGDFYLSYKDGAPTWYNPHSGWSEGMPETIGPGPTNPLGVRALAVSCGNGIFLHGTTNTGGLGSPGSHGCVRLSNNNIIDLYNRVSEGIPIIIR